MPYYRRRYYYRRPYYYYDYDYYYWPYYGPYYYDWEYYRVTPFEPYAKLISPLRVFYYNCDGVDDNGWGCGWRCVQMILYVNNEKNSPSFRKLVEDSSGGIWGQWADSSVLTDSLLQAGIQTFRDQPQILVSDTRSLKNLESILQDYFAQSIALPAMLVGTGQIAVICGIRRKNRETYEVYIIDPHGPPINLAEYSDGSIGYFNFKVWRHSFIITLSNPNPNR